MIEHGQDLPLGAEALEDLLRAHAGIDQLDRDFLGEALVVARGAIDHAHAAAADLFDDPVGADPVARGRGSAEAGAGGSSEEAAGFLVGGEQRAHLVRQRRSSRGDLVKNDSRAAGIELERLVEVVLIGSQRAPVEGGLSLSPGVIAAASAKTLMPLAPKTSWIGESPGRSGQEGLRLSENPLLPAPQ